MTHRDSAQRQGIYSVITGAYLYRNVDEVKCMVQIYPTPPRTRSPHLIAPQPNITSSPNQPAPYRAKHLLTSGVSVMESALVPVGVRPSS